MWENGVCTSLASLGKTFLVENSEVRPQPEGHPCLLFRISVKFLTQFGLK